MRTCVTLARTLDLSIIRHIRNLPFGKAFGFRNEITGALARDTKLGNDALTA